MRRIYAATGLEIHTITYNDLEGRYGQTLAVPQSTEALCTDMREAMSEAALPGLNVVVVRHYAQGGLLGLSCGIPGFPSRPDISNSGVTVAGFLLTHDPWLFGSVMAHEMGHYLGLFHTTEFHGLLHDPIDDTLECHWSQDYTRDRVLSADECAEHGGIYNMFWSGPQESDFLQHTVTEGQRFVLMRNPMVETY
ncbi:hypothetical protein EA187_02430 [Lujinxingia sediminis]|uniref:Peptidase M43 pregnancy-associated plasma-A domain-containing protein n=1 Tax=Lujinxingia sediminis TaxID=2480984 RepID=A0ABY0CX89_9DELT|nr:hypothetical protein [Lujinxingia sediminis]RVU48314.1 hypothetical protein EA187_02430 [Lujinxingia sediminis]